MARYAETTLKSGMGGSNNGKGRTDKTEVMKKRAKKARRRQGKEYCKQY